MAKDNLKLRFIIIKDYLNKVSLMDMDSKELANTNI